MATTHKRFTHSVIANSQATLYTVPAGTRAVIWRATVENVSGSAVTLTLWAVPSGGSAANGNVLLKEMAIPAFGSGPVDLRITNHVLEAGGFLRAVASANDAIVLAVSGVEVV